MIRYTIVYLDGSRETREAPDDVALFVDLASEVRSRLSEVDTIHRSKCLASTISHASLMWARGVLLRRDSVFSVEGERR